MNWFYATKTLLNENTIKKFDTQKNLIKRIVKNFTVIYKRFGTVRRRHFYCSKVDFNL